jgi:hypothetical protein
MKRKYILAPDEEMVPKRIYDRLLKECDALYQTKVRLETTLADERKIFQTWVDKSKGSLGNGWIG